MKKILVWTLLYFSSLIINQVEAKFPYDPSTLDVSIYEILANPSHFDGRKVRVVGVAGNVGNEGWVQILSPTIEHSRYGFPGLSIRVTSFDSEKMLESVKMAKEYKETMTQERLATFFQSSLNSRRYWSAFTEKYVMVTGIVKITENGIHNWKKTCSLENIECVYPLQ